MRTYRPETWTPMAHTHEPRRLTLGTDACARLLRKNTRACAHTSHADSPLEWTPMLTLTHKHAHTPTVTVMVTVTNRCLDHSAVHEF